MSVVIHMMRGITCVPVPVEHSLVSVQEFALKASDGVKGGKSSCKFVENTMPVMFDSDPRDAIGMSVKGSILT